MYLRISKLTDQSISKEIITAVSNGLHIMYLNCVNIVNDCIYIYM